MNDNFRIRSDYTARSGNQTFDTDDRTFWDPARILTGAVYQYAVYQWAQELLQDVQAPRVLDVGCGPATKLVNILSTHADVHGIDQPNAVNYCRQTHPVGQFYADDFEKPELTLDIQFDLIICSDVIEHMDNPDVLLTYIKRFSGPATEILLSTPDRDRYRGKACTYSPKPEHVREWAADEFLEYLRSRDFQIIESRHLPPVRTGLNLLTFKQLAYQYAHFRPYNYSFAALCKRAN